MPTSLSEAILQAGSFSKAVAVTPSDGADLASIAGALYIGGAGNLSLILADDSAAVTFNAAAGDILRLKVKRVRATGTTATNIVALRV